jgi:hypothetical protein
MRVENGRPEGTLKAPTLVQGMMILTALAALATAAVAVAAAKGKMNWGGTKIAAGVTGAAALGTAAVAGRNWHVAKRDEAAEAARGTARRGSTERRGSGDAAAAAEAAARSRSRPTIDVATTPRPTNTAAVLALVPAATSVDFEGSREDAPACVEAGVEAQNPTDVWATFIGQINTARGENRQVLIRNASEGFLSITEVSQAGEITASWGPEGTTKVTQRFAATGEASYRAIILRG